MGTSTTETRAHQPLLARASAALPERYGVDLREALSAALCCVAFSGP